MERLKNQVKIQEDKEMERIEEIANLKKVIKNIE